MSVFRDVKYREGLKGYYRLEQSKNVISVQLIQTIVSAKIKI